ncbi:MerR family transcriptional regulator [Streptomyces sp. NRRL WC-3618]|uniref:helix-turn-helix domain-containing protein n=1 Tax=Streptomyces sp. NRRL WC-3618 TaxID=1519490 RepID=UPI0006AF4062|nr:MerR family transcriptional regulator [Streptomyces sp. NRRL WC-3618]KOV68508.1 MerR family transcriptional regulator [Streptomyces sp. NRRL WC-3618]
MDDERPDVLTIGRLAHRTGLPVRTLRFWSDEGAVPPVGRSAGGYRLYDAESVARVELVRTLRELGLGLDDACRVLSGRTTVAQVADAHVAALDAQIRSLKVSRAVLSTVAKRGSTVEETALMNRLARLSAAERKQIIDEFKEEVFGGLDDPRLRDRMRAFSIELPDDPTPEQVDAWIELAELVRDPGFRTRLRTWMELNTPIPGQGPPPGASIWWARQIVQTVAEVRKGGVAPEGPAAAEVLAELFGDADRAAVLRGLEAGIEAGAEHYRRLVARVRGQSSSPDATEELEWLARALRAADQT